MGAGGPPKGRKGVGEGLNATSLGPLGKESAICVNGSWERGVLEKKSENFAFSCSSRAERSKASAARLTVGYKKVSSFFCTTQSGSL